MSKQYWLMKSEPDAFSWDDLTKAGETVWDGVRNHRAKNNLAAMNVGDEAFFYHSRTGKEIVGIMRVIEAGIADPTDPAGKWAAVRVEPVRKLNRPVSLQEIRAEPRLSGIELIKISRLSVAAITPLQWGHILAMSDAVPG